MPDDRSTPVLAIVNARVWTNDPRRPWADALLVREFDDHYAWCGWSATWEATPGDHVLCCRATDETGDTQPLEPEWNLGGYENNAVQRVRVHVD